MTESTAPTANRAALGIVFLVVFIDLLGFGIVLPLLPRFGDDLLKRDLQLDGAAAGAVLGLLMSSFSAMQFLFAPLWGQLSDRVGRRPVLLVGPELVQAGGGGHRLRGGGAVGGGVGVGAGEVAGDADRRRQPGEEALRRAGAAPHLPRRRGGHAGADLLFGVVRLRRLRGDA